MLFTWDTDKLCIVFKWWRVTSTLSLVVSLVAVMAIVAGYEALREGIRQYEAWVNKRAETAIRKSTSLPFPSGVIPSHPPPGPFVLFLSILYSNPPLRSSAPENPPPLLNRPRSSGQAKVGPASRTGPILSSRSCTAFRTSTPS